MDDGTEWAATRRELAQLGWAVLLIDAIALALGALAARYVGAGSYWVGVSLAGFVTLSFVFVVAINLAGVWVARLWLRRHR